MEHSVYVGSQLSSERSPPGFIHLCSAEEHHHRIIQSTKLKISWTASGFQSTGSSYLADTLWVFLLLYTVGQKPHSHCESLTLADDAFRGENSILRVLTSISDPAPSQFLPTWEDSVVILDLSCNISFPMLLSALSVHTYYGGQPWFVAIWWSSPALFSDLNKTRFIWIDWRSQKRKIFLLGIHY